VRVHSIAHYDLILERVHLSTRNACCDVQVTAYGVWLAEKIAAQTKQEQLLQVGGRLAWGKQTPAAAGADYVSICTITEVHRMAPTAIPWTVNLAPPS
jgi:hypothetical protein